MLQFCYSLWIYKKFVMMYLNVLLLFFFSPGRKTFFSPHMIVEDYDPFAVARCQIIIYCNFAIVHFGVRYLMFDCFLGNKIKFLFCSMIFSYQRSNIFLDMNHVIQDRLKTSPPRSKWNGFYFRPLFFKPLRS